MYCVKSNVNEFLKLLPKKYVRIVFAALLFYKWNDNKLSNTQRISIYRKLYIICI